MLKLNIKPWILVVLIIPQISWSDIRPATQAEIQQYKQLVVSEATTVKPQPKPSASISNPHPSTISDKTPLPSRKLPPAPPHENSIYAAAKKTWRKLDASVQARAKKYIEKKSSLGFDDVWRKRDNCSPFYIGNDPQNPQRGESLFHHCADGTFSYDQPQDKSKFEGNCGNVAVSNAVIALCSRAIDPRKVLTLTKDITPGTRPDTMLKAIRTLTREGGCPTGSWKFSSLMNAQEYISDIKNALYSGHSSTGFTPVITLLGNVQMHWVVVSGIIENRNDQYGCDLIMNSWGGQYKLSCSDAAKFSKTMIGRWVLGFN